MTKQAEAIEKPLAVIPFELEDNIIYLKVSVNDSEPLTYILDTGASNSVLSRGSMEQMNLKSAGEVPIGGAGNGTAFGNLLENVALRVKGLEDFPIPVLVAIPLAHLEPFVGRRIDGILGSEFFNQFAVKINYRRKHLEVFDGDKFEYAGNGKIIPFALKLNHIHIDADIFLNGDEKITGDFVVDTGSSEAVFVTRQFIEENRILEKLSAKLEVPTLGAGAGGDIKGLVGKIEKLRMGDLEIISPLIHLSQDEAGAMATSEFFEGNIGAAILKKFDVIFDYKNLRMIFEKNVPEENKTEFDRSGIFLKKEGGNYVIFGIVKNSPAEDTGILVGDILKGLAGVRVKEFTLPEIREKLRGKGNIKLEILRNGEFLKKEIALRDLMN